MRILPHPDTICGIGSQSLEVLKRSPPATHNASRGTPTCAAIRIGSTWSSISNGSQAFADGVSGISFLLGVPFILWVISKAMPMLSRATFIMQSETISIYSGLVLSQRLRIFLQS